MAEYGASLSRKKQIDAAVNKATAKPTPTPKPKKKAKKKSGGGMSDDAIKKFFNNL